ncbi:MAG: PIN domain-containing protein [Boseongicola sp. SB0676_bin_33]|nr:PIN domain-containing protein [Boseongicola sp. SB0676_bin_33]
MRSLLDVNVLIALLDAEHVHHDAAREWMRENIRHGWATCPITQNGCLRVMAQPGYPHRIPPSLVAERLREATSTSHHRFWPDSVSLLDANTVDWSRIIGPRQITDIYLLALAVAHGGRFVTFDARIAPEMVPGGKESLCLV